MSLYNVIIESKEYNPRTHRFEDKQFSGEFEAKAEKGAKIKAKRLYSIALDTEPNEIKVVSVELIK